MKVSIEEYQRRRGLWYAWLRDPFSQIADFCEQNPPGLWQEGTY